MPNKAVVPDQPNQQNQENTMTDEGQCEQEYNCEGRLCGSISGDIKMYCECNCPEPIVYKTKLVAVPPNIETDTVQQDAQNYLNANPGVLLMQILDVGQNGWVLVVSVPV